MLKNYDELGMSLNMTFGNFEYFFEKEEEIMFNHSFMEIKIQREIIKSKCVVFEMDLFLHYDDSGTIIT